MASSIDIGLGTCCTCRDTVLRGIVAAGKMQVAATPFQHLGQLSTGLACKDDAAEVGWRVCIGAQHCVVGTEVNNDSIPVDPIAGNDAGAKSFPINLTELQM